MTKKIFIALLLFLFTFSLVGCDLFGSKTTTTTATTFDTSGVTTTTTTTTTVSESTSTSNSDLATLTGLANLVIISDQDNMTTSFTVPAEVGDATVTWGSSNSDYVSVASATILNDLGKFVYPITVTRPDQTTGTVTVTLTGTFVLGDATYEKAFVLRVQFEEDTSLVTTISAGLAQPLGTFLTWKDMTILGVGTDGFFFTDGTDIMFVYSAAVAATVQAGEVYDINGGIGLYNNVPEVQNLETNIVSVTPSTAAARTVEPVVATIDEIIANHVGYDATNPMQFEVYTVTGKVYYDSALSANYTTFLIPEGTSTLDKAHAIRIYYKANMAAVTALAGQTITLDLVLFGFNNAAGYGDWYAYFFGTAEDIVAETMTDADKLAVSVGQLASSYDVTSSLTLPTLSFGSITNVTVSTEISDYLSYSGGVFSVVRPSADTTGSISVTISYNAETETVVIPVTMKAEVVVVEGDDIFISEYIEGSSYNKFIELYNPLDVTVDLSEYTLELYSNGATAPTGTMTLSGTLAPGAVIVLSHADATIFAAAIENSSVINFNGDDAFVLKHNGTVVDSIGKIGERPSVGYWGTTTLGTKDNTLVRLSSVTGGDTDPYDDYDPSTQWVAYSVDTATYLGSHTVD
ncbi:MAG: lamin tail domain-containing protein [Firmicutes bacterium]|nr:lamin tail domain-containing protein [Bacillota bacterium]